MIPSVSDARLKASIRHPSEGEIACFEILVCYGVCYKTGHLQEYKSIMGQAVSCFSHMERSDECTLTKAVN